MKYQSHKPEQRKDDFPIVNKEMESLIIGYLTSDISREGLVRLSQWLNECKEHTAYFNRMKAAWILAGAKQKPVDTETSWKELSQKTTEYKKAKVHHITWQQTLGVAASFLLVFALGAVTMNLFEHKAIELTVTPAVELTETTVEAPLGSISKVTLPDSSQVWLNAGSKIRYNSDFGKDSRDLELTGEAFFSVKTNPEKPFLVKAYDVTVRATGTRFNVKAYPEESSVTATLEEGIIDVSIANVKHGEILLKPKEKVVINRQASKAMQVTATEQKQDVSAPEVVQEEKQDIRIISGVNTTLSTSWKDKQWQVNDESMASFIPMLARRYNYEIEIRDPELNQYKFTGTIENESIEHILEALQQTAPLNCIMTKERIVLTINQTNKAKFTPILKNRK